MKYLNADGLKVKVDDADYTELLKFNWHIKWRTPRHPYVYRYEKRAQTDLAISRFRCIRIHRQIMRFPSLSVDHINGDPLDNRRRNLRLATQQQQACNTRRHDGKYKGVTHCPLIHGKYKSNYPYHARIRVDGKLLTLGYFATPTEAARAYNKAARKYFGEFACLNDIKKVEREK